MRTNNDNMIDPEFVAIIPPLSDEELAGLTASIVADGCRDPLVLWRGHGLILDGHNRYRICTDNSIPYGVTFVTLPDRAAAIAWVIQNQFNRRNLTTFQRAELALKFEPVIAAAAAARRLGCRPLGTKLSGKPINTAQAMADITGLSDVTMRRASYLNRTASPAVLNDLRAGKTNITHEWKRANAVPEYRDTVVRLKAALKEIAAYEPGNLESPRATVDKLQDMASRAIMGLTKSQPVEELVGAI